MKVHILTKKLSIKRYFNTLVEFPDHGYFSNDDAQREFSYFPV